MTRPSLHWIFACLSILGALSLASCTSVGPKRLPVDRFDYNEAISESRKQQMLTNIIRIRYFDFPVFMSVGSVITSYDYASEVGVEGTTGLSEAVGGGDIITGTANIAFAERPTITYAPISGREFTERLLTPLPVGAIFALSQAGWDIEMLLLTGIHRINNVENLSFEVIPIGEDTDSKQRQQQDIENLRKFRRVIDLFWHLVDEDIIEMQREDKASLPKLVFDTNGREQYLPLLKELRELLDLDMKRNVFQVTTRMTRRQPDEVTIQSRSLSSIMAFLSKGIDVPRAHLVEGRTEGFPQSEDGQSYVPLRVRSQREQPSDAFVAVQYQGYWFYLDQSDIQSKLVFQMLLALFELQAPAGGAVAPLLTLPAGG